MKYFKENNDWEYNSRIFPDDNISLYYGEGYKLTIDLIEKEILENDRSDQDFMIYPYCFIVRHYIEIRLKEIVFEGNKIVAEELTFKPTHNLSQLWNQSQEVLKNVWKQDFRKAPNNISKFINEFHSIDFKSDAFRYPIGTNGNKNLNNIKVINFREISKIVNEVKNYLDGITDGLSVLKEKSNTNSEIENTPNKKDSKKISYLAKILSWLNRCKTYY